MDSAEPHFEVALCGDTVYVRAVGLASMRNTACLRDFLNKMRRQGYRTVIIDLEACTGMDSTFLGIMAGVADPLHQDESASVTVINGTEQQVKLLHRVGLAEFMDVVSKPVPRPRVETQPMYDGSTPEERVDLVLQAHRKLVELSADNEKEFGPFVARLEREMGKRGA